MPLIDAIPDRFTMSWMKKSVPHVPAPLVVPAEYRPLHRYLHGRSEGAVILTFAEIEDLLGFTLPPPARVQHEWWASAGRDGRPSDQARAWIRASRTARAFLKLEKVAFDRTPA